MTTQYPVNDHWIIWGDGNMAQIIDSKEYIKLKTGIKMVKFILLPSRMIEQMYPIEELVDPRTHAIVMEYPHADVIWLVRGTTRSRAIVVTDFLGGQTPLSRRDEDLRTALLDTERMLKSLQSAKNRAYAELDKEREQQLLAIKTKVRMVREVRRATGQQQEGDGQMGQDQGEYAEDGQM